MGVSSVAKKRRYSYKFEPGKNPKKGILKDFGVFDIETNRWSEDKPTVIEPFLVTYYDKHHPNGVFFDKPNTLIMDFVEWYVNGGHRKGSRRSPFVTFAHNGGKFDFIPINQMFSEEPRFVRNNIMPGCKDVSKYSPRLLIIKNGSILEMKFYGGRNGRYLFRFRDSMGLMAESLARLSGPKGFNVKQKKWAKKRISKLFKTSYSSNKQEWRDYCLQDCKALYGVISAFKKEIESLGGVVYNTIAKTALLGVYQRKYLKHSIPTYHRYNDIIHDVFKGGRTEVFNLYAPPRDDAVYNYYDFNSLYPSVMHDNLFPIGKPRGYAHCDEDDFKNDCGFAYATIHVPARTYLPFVPFRLNKKLFFPTGELTDWFDGLIINEAFKHGYNVKLHRAYFFKDSDYIFRDYVGDIYSKRVKSSGSLKKTLKLVLNSSYGKFAQRSTVKSVCTRSQLPKDASSVRVVNADYDLMEYEKEIFAPYMLPGIASRVTAGGQMKILHAMEDCLKHDGVVYYCDTDSVLTDARLPSSTRLGALKLECTFESGVFLQPKTYTLYNVWESGKPKDDILKMKGYDLSEADKKMIDYHTLENALMTRNYDLLKYSRFKPKPIKSLWKLSEKNNGIFRHITDENKKSFQTEYDKRHVNYNDFTTRSLVYMNGKLY